MQFTALGGAMEVGASCMLLQIAGKNILLDAGIRVNRRGNASLPDLDKLKELAGDKLDLVLVSHAHLDHAGALPLVLERYPTTQMYCTPPTKVILQILLEDTVKIMEQESEEHKESLLYNREMVDRVLWALKATPSSEWISPIDGVEFYFHPAGHIMGAACILIKTPEGKVVYTGDIATAEQRTASGIENIDFFQPDALIIESTYGDGAHAKRKIEEQRLAQSVAEVIKRGGTALIPSFALGRAQELILILKQYIVSGVIPKFPIYVDGMVRAICDAYTDLIDYLPQKLQNWVKNSQQMIFWSRPRKNLPEVTKLVPTERPLMLLGEPKCIISSSGMLTGGPSVYYARALAHNPNNAIFFTGYQDEESPGRRLLELEKGDTLKLEGEEVPIKCDINKYNLSAHADQIQLCQQISYMNPRTVVLVHGDPAAIQILRQKLVLKGIVHVPHNGETIDLTKQPDWLTEYTHQRIDAERLTFHGTLEADENEIVFRFTDKKLINSPQWKQFFTGYKDVKAKFMGKWLHVRGLVEQDEGQDDD